MAGACAMAQNLLKHPFGRFNRDDPAQRRPLVDKFS
jgi:hypothetical protein